MINKRGSRTDPCGMPVKFNIFELKERSATRVVTFCCTKRCYICTYEKTTTISPKGWIFFIAKIEKSCYCLVLFSGVMIVFGCFYILLQHWYCKINYLHTVEYSYNYIQLFKLELVLFWLSPNVNRDHIYKMNEWTHHDITYRLVDWCFEALSLPV